MSCNDFHRYSLDKLIRQANDVLILETNIASEDVKLRIFIVGPEKWKSTSETVTVLNLCGYASALWIAMPNTQESMPRELMNSCETICLRNKSTLAHGLITRNDGAIPRSIENIVSKCETQGIEIKELHQFNSSMLIEGIINGSVIKKRNLKFMERMWEANVCSYNRLLQALKH